MLVHASPGMFSSTAIAPKAIAAKNSILKLRLQSISMFNLNLHRSVPDSPTQSLEEKFCLSGCCLHERSPRKQPFRKFCSYLSFSYWSIWQCPNSSVLKLVYLCVEIVCSVNADYCTLSETKLSKQFEKDYFFTLLINQPQLEQFHYQNNNDLLRQNFA